MITLPVVRLIIMAPSRARYRPGTERPAVVGGPSARLVGRSWNAKTGHDFEQVMSELFFFVG
jgi:hypothetical protein